MKRSVYYIARWFLSYPTLGLTAALLIWVLTFDGLSSLGLPDLFWRIDWKPSFCAGIGIALVFLTVIFVGFLLQSTIDAGLTFHQYAKRTAWFLYLPVIVGAFFAHRTYWWALLLGLAAGSSLLFAMKPIHARLSTTRQPLETHHFQARYVFGIALAFYVAFAIVPPLYRFVSAPLAICVLLILIVMPYGYSYYRFPRSRFAGTFILIALMLLMNVRGYRYRFPSFDYAQKQKFVPRPFTGVKDSLDAWLKQEPDRNRRMLVIITSGGGVRAAAWTSEVLNRLQSKNSNFARHVRVITGASGGMVGAADFVGRLRANKPTDGHMTSIANNALDDVARSLVLHDVPKLFHPFATDDRGVALEEKWTSLSSVMSLTFDSLRAGEAAGTLPSLIFTPTIVEDGRRLVISNLDLGTALDSRLSTGAVELFKIFPDVQKKMPLATAARMSASFPYVSPAAELPTIPRRHLVDAGYFDTFGGNVAVAWLAAHKSEIAEKHIDVMLIELRDGAAQNAAMKIDLPGSSAGVDYLGEPLAPILAVLNVTFGAIIHRNNRDIDLVSHVVSPELRRFENASPDDQPLSWALTDAQRQQLCNEVDRQEPQIDEVNRWLREPNPLPHS